MNTSRSPRPGRREAGNGRARRSGRPVVVLLVLALAGCAQRRPIAIPDGATGQAVQETPREVVDLLVEGLTHPVKGGARFEPCPGTLLAGQPVRRWWLDPAGTGFDRRRDELLAEVKRMSQVKDVMPDPRSFAVHVRGVARVLLGDRYGPGRAYDGEVVLTTMSEVDLRGPGCQVPS